MVGRVVLFLLYVASAFAGEPLVETTKGTLRGHQLISRKGRSFYAFQGVPYAKPPVGQLRFKDPEPIEAWTGVRDAVKDAEICIQKDLFGRFSKPRGSEDCLYLNVFTPSLPKGQKSKKLPVLFWIHGGGWISGSGMSDHYGPSLMMDHDVVLVSINYRLANFGFLSTGDAASPGNYGMKDQVAALEWVKDNIAKFGGDPKSVTIAGESAGGASVHYHYFSPLSKGLFHRGISMSGTALNSWAVPVCFEKYNQQLAKRLNCPITTNEDFVDCLRLKSAEELTDNGPELLSWKMSEAMPLRPTVEKVGTRRFLTKTPEELLKDPNFKIDKPWVTGITSEDGAVKSVGILVNPKIIEEFNDNFEEFAAADFKAEGNSPDTLLKKVRKFYFGDKPVTETSVQNIVDYYTDYLFLLDVDRAIKIHVKKFSSPVFYYVFGYRGKHSITTNFGDPIRDYGVCHMDELQYLFDMEEYFPRAKKTLEDNQMVEIFTQLVVNFMKTGNPTPQVCDMLPVKWKPVHSVDRPEYLEIGREFKTGQGLYSKRVEFWEELLPKLRASKDEL